VVSGVFSFFLELQRCELDSSVGIPSNSRLREYLPACKCIFHTTHFKMSASEDEENKHGLSVKEECESLGQEVYVLAQTMYRDDVARAVGASELQALLEKHPWLDVDAYQGEEGRRALYWACRRGSLALTQLLIEHNADVNARTHSGFTPLIPAAACASLECVSLLLDEKADVNATTTFGFTALTWGALPPLENMQLLLDHKASIHSRNHEHQDALYSAMRVDRNGEAPGRAFAVLCCNTDVKNLQRLNTIDFHFLEQATVSHFVAQYQEIQGDVAQYHSVLHFTLSEHVQVDTRVGRGDNGLYHEPLERVLEYMGLSMRADRIVNWSIDGQGGRSNLIKRVLIPGHMLNAKHWYDMFAA
jgi:hypothetical protein